METAVLLVLLIILSAVFSGGELAVFSVPRARVEVWAEEGRPGARTLKRLRERPERLLITILIGNNVANIGAASVATYAATEAFGSAGVGIATGGMTLLVLFFGEIVPKAFAASNSRRISLALAPAFLTLSRLLWPLVAPLDALTRAVLPQRDRALPTVTEAEIRALAVIGHAAGAIDAHERQIIERAFALDSTSAWDVMTPRVEIFAWPADLRLREIADELRRVPFSRIPVYRDSLDEITGILHVRDAYQALLAGRHDARLEELAREPLAVPASITLSQLLTEFRARRIHLGVVVDEHGGTDGIVTLEDVLEELVGEIADELDVPEERIRRVGECTVIADGAADLKEINRILGTEFPVHEHRSLNGFLLHAFGRVPEPGETVSTQGVEIIVLSATETRVKRARITRVETPDGADATEDATSED